MNEAEIVRTARERAAEWHADQTRKGTDIPYLDGHLEPVARLVRDSGGTDVQVAAAYLHDAVEDVGGLRRLGEIEAEFGPEVAGMVHDLSDSVVDTRAGETKAPWSERKTAYLASMRTKPVASLEVSLADKLQNATCMRDDYRDIGSMLWTRFNEGRPEAQLWYYGSLAARFAERLPDHPFTARLAATVAEIRALVEADVPDLDERISDFSAHL